MKKANRRMEINSHRPGLTFDPPTPHAPRLPLSREGDVSERSSITAVSRYRLPSGSLCRCLETREALHEVSVTPASLGSFSPDGPAPSAHSFTSFTSPWKPICAAVPLSLTRMDFVHLKHLHYSCVGENAAAN